MSSYLHQMKIFFNQPNLHTVKSIFQSYPDKDTMAFRKQVIYWASENHNLSIFKEAINHSHIPQCENCIYISMTNNEFAMLHFLIKKWTCNIDTIQKICIHISQYILTHNNISFLDMWYIQNICFKINCRATNKIVTGMARLYAIRIKKARIVMYKNAVRIVYNPIHPVGKKCFQNELDYINNLNIKNEF